ncbi:MAG: hypothetical protein AAFZ99_14515 [Pseudomonadota bacterium]
MFTRIWAWLDENAKQLGAVKTVFGIIGSFTAVAVAAFVYLYPSDDGQLPGDREAVVTLPLKELEAREQRLQLELERAREEAKILTAKLERLTSEGSHSRTDIAGIGDRHDIEARPPILDGAPSCSRNVVALEELGREVSDSVLEELEKISPLLDFDPSDISDASLLCSWNSDVLGTMYSEAIEASTKLETQTRRMRDVFVCANQWLDFIGNTQNVSDELKDSLVHELERRLDSIREPAMQSTLATVRLQDSLSQIVDLAQAHTLICES